MRLKVFKLLVVVVNGKNHCFKMFKTNLLHPLINTFLNHLFTWWKHNQFYEIYGPGLIQQRTADGEWLLVSPSTSANRPPSRISRYLHTVKLWEGKSNSISHAFLLRRGRDSAILSFDEQGLGCVILPSKLSSQDLNCPQLCHFYHQGECTQMHTLPFILKNDD